MRAVSLDPQQVVLRKGQRPVRRAELSEDINVTIWNKFVFLTGLSAMTALTGHPVGRLREDPDTRELLEQLMNEALRVAQASGVPIGDAVVAERLLFIDGLPAQIRASMAFDRSDMQRIAHSTTFGFRDVGAIRLSTTVLVALGTGRLPPRGGPFFSCQ
jgi:hypothetical protein